MTKPRTTASSLLIALGLVASGCPDDTPAGQVIDVQPLDAPGGDDGQASEMPSTTDAADSLSDPGVRDDGPEQDTGFEPDGADDDPDQAGPLDAEPDAANDLPSGPTTVTLTVNIIGKGSVDISPPGPWTAGQEVTLSATAAPIWTFESWSGDASGADAVLSLVLTEDTLVSATFVRPGTTKYWTWRDRLLDSFVRAGEGQGRSLPAEYWMEALQFIKWSDGTMHLGFYLGVLATECHMLANPDSWPGFENGRPDPLGACYQELRQALLAAERVDLVAEGSFFPGLPDVPGFFIRDDVPADFHVHFPGMALAMSDFSAIESPTNKEMSQDQVIHLLQGLSLVKRLIPAGTVIDGTDLRAEAIERATLIVEYVAADDWIIYNPYPTQHRVARGADCSGYSHGFSKSLFYMTDGQVDLSSTVNPLWQEAFGTLSSPLNPIYLNEDNVHMAMVLISVGRAFGDETLDVLMELAELHEFYLYPLEHLILWEGLTTYPSQAAHLATLAGIVNDWIATAPMTGARYPLGDAGECALGWCASNRFIREEAKHYGSSTGDAGQDYNGLDFLLVHNALAIAAPESF